MEKISIYVGLNDADTRLQEYDTKRYIFILKSVCQAYHVAFSVHTVEGGYFHEDGSFVDETTLVLTLMDVADDIMEEIAKDLCVFFHQESVMITKAVSEVYFIKERLETGIPKKIDHTEE